MQNPESIFKTICGFLFFFVPTLLMIMVFQPSLKDTGIDTKVASLCLEKMEQGLSIPDLPVASQKVLIVDGIDCLKSAPNIDTKKIEYETFFSVAQNIVEEQSIDDKSLRDLLENINFLQNNLQKMSQEKAFKTSVSFVFGLAGGGVIMMIILLINVCITYGIPLF